MTGLYRKITYAFCLVLGLIFIGSILHTDTAAAQSLLPEGLAIEDVFKPGIGKAIGKTELVQGDVVIMHSDKAMGYRAKDGLPLYKGDTIFTEERGRARLLLNDNSVLTLASRTKMVLTRSIYDPEKQSRSSFLGMDLGKARFFVTKLTGFKRSEFKVKTKTAVAGVRGSDFIIEATDLFTQITTGKDTILDVVSLAYLEKPPVTLQDFQRTSVEEGELPSEVEDVTADEVESMIRRDFVMGADEGEGEDQEVETEGEGEEEGSEEEGAEDEEQATDEGTSDEDETAGDDADADTAASTTNIVVDVDPADAGLDDESTLPDVSGSSDIDNTFHDETTAGDNTEDDIQDTNDDINANVSETTAKSYNPLPDFPDAPER